MTTSNHPTGFSGFQSRMEQMEEQLGGDWLASRTVEQKWAEALDAVQSRRQRHQEVGLAYRAHYRGKFVRARDEDWSAAADLAEGLFPPLGPQAFVSKVEYDGQVYAVTDRSLFRLGRDPEGSAILLARSRKPTNPFSREAEVALSETGLALIEHRQFKRVRSKYRRCSPEGIEKTLRSFASAMGVEFPA